CTTAGLALNTRSSGVAPPCTVTRNGAPLQVSVSSSVPACVIGTPNVAASGPRSEKFCGHVSGACASARVAPSTHRAMRIAAARVPETREFVGKISSPARGVLAAVREVDDLTRDPVLQFADRHFAVGIRVGRAIADALEQRVREHAVVPLLTFERELA